MDTVTKKNCDPVREDLSIFVDVENLIHENDASEFSKDMSKLKKLGEKISSKERVLTKSLTFQVQMFH